MSVLDIKIEEIDEIIKGNKLIFVELNNVFYNARRKTRAILHSW